MYYRLSVLSLLLVGFGFLSSCGGSGTTAKKKSSYDGPVVSYTNQVAPIIKRSCAPCHFPEEKGKKEALDTYQSLRDEIHEVIKRVEMSPDHSKYMPFKQKQPGLSADEIELLKNWARGGFQD